MPSQIRFALKVVAQKRKTDTLILMPGRNAIKKDIEAIRVAFVYQLSPHCVSVAHTNPDGAVEDDCEIVLEAVFSRCDAVAKTIGGTGGFISVDGRPVKAKGSGVGKKLSSAF